MPEGCPGVQRPFSERCVRQIIDATEWTYRKEEFDDEAEYEDGTKPARVLRLWRPWIVDCLRLLDGDGAYAHYMNGVALADEPAVDMRIFDLIRQRWNEMRNEELKAQYGRPGKS